MRRQCLIVNLLCDRLPLHTMSSKMRHKNQSVATCVQSAVCGLKVTGLNTRSNLPLTALVAMSVIKQMRYCVYTSACIWFWRCFRLWPACKASLSPRTLVKTFSALFSALLMPHTTQSFRLIIQHTRTAAATFATLQASPRNSVGMWKVKTECDTWAVLYT